MCFDIGVVTCGPNEALIISGVFYGNRPNMLVGGRAIVCPCIQMVQRIPLSTMTLIIESPRVYTSQGVPISVTGVAQVDRQRGITRDDGLPSRGSTGYPYLGLSILFPKPGRCSLTCAISTWPNKYSIFK